MSLFCLFFSFPFWVDNPFVSRLRVGCELRGGCVYILAASSAGGWAVRRTCTTRPANVLLHHLSSRLSLALISFNLFALTDTGRRAQWPLTPHTPVHPCRIGPGVTNLQRVCHPPSRLQFNGRRDASVYPCPGAQASCSRENTNEPRCGVGGGGGGGGGVVCGQSAANGGLRGPC